MATRNFATTILEFLTHQNPEVRHLSPNSSTTTRNDSFYWPKETKPWDQFENFDVFKSAFRGRLYKAAIRKSERKFHYPYYKGEVDLNIRDEKKTRSLVDKWNHTIVTQALEEVDEFKPSYWANDDPNKSTKKPEMSSSPASGGDSSSRHRRVPDAGSIMLYGDTDQSPDGESRERFPKEYKPAGKWSSTQSIQQNLLGRHRRSHKWGRDLIRKKQAWPIRQAFTYCIDTMCRYGCILTCKEAFIFRVKPIEPEPDSKEPQDPEQLKQALIDNGMIEYVIVPWANHTQGGANSTWTVNLALWFVHVLAGHRFEVAWEYDAHEYEGLGGAFLPISASGIDNGKTDTPGVEKVAVLVATEEGRNGEGETQTKTSSEVSKEDKIRRSEGNPFTPLKKRKRESKSPDVLDSPSLPYSKRRL